jgi:hypothetical protein
MSTDFRLMRQLLVIKSSGSNPVKIIPIYHAWMIFFSNFH